MDVMKYNAYRFLGLFFAAFAGSAMANGGLAVGIGAALLSLALLGVHYKLNTSE